MIEMIATTLEDALTIEQAGGERIELITAFSEGGLTPSYGLIEQVLSSVNIPVNVMLRPHSRSFQYSAKDLMVMKADAKIMEELGVKTVVLGILDEDGLPDVPAMEAVLRNTSLSITFHRAIDESSDIMKSLEILNCYARCECVLTSGGPGKATDHFDVLRKMKEQMERLSLLVGSGVSERNMGKIREEIGECEFHIGTAVRNGSFLLPVQSDVALRLVDEYKRIAGMADL